jgi:hypothetical protein
VIRYVISALAISLVAAHIIWPHIAVDAITLGLFAIAVLPWLSSLFKSIELPGGLKVEYQELIKAKEKVERSGLLKDGAVPTKAQYSFLAVSDQDPNLALAGLRIEIERRLRQLAVATGGEPRVGGSGGLMHELRERGVLTEDQFSALRGLTGLLNSAVHGAIVTPRAASWAIEFGPQLLGELDARLLQVEQRDAP